MGFLKSCRPHWWVMPKVGDTHLVCERCHRRKPYGELSDYLRESISRGQVRLRGYAFGALFRRDLYAACEALYPRRPAGHTHQK